MDERTDEQLAPAVSAGDQAALAELIARHHTPLLGYLSRLVEGDRPLAEDLTQETFLRALRHGAYPANRPFKPWLYTIATNLARDYFKSAAVRQRSHSGEEEGALLETCDGAPGPEARALAAERGDEVQAALAQLSAEHRVVIVLRFYQGFTLQEIAETLRIPLGTVKSRLSLALRRLRAVLAPIHEGVD